MQRLTTMEDPSVAPRLDSIGSVAAAGGCTTR